MKVGIIYATHFGFCEQAAREVARKLKTPSEIIKFDYKSRYNLSKYDALIIGGSIRMGLLDQDFIGWLHSHKDEISAKPHALFLACGFPEDFDTYVTNCIPEDIVNSSLATVNIGGSLDGTFKWYDKLLVKMMSKNVAKTGKAVAEPHLENFDTVARVIDDTVRNIPQETQEPEA